MELTPLRENFVTKSIEPKSEALTSEHQLSFDDFFAEEDNAAKLALIPYTDYHLINAKEFTFPKRRFFILSVITHLIIVAWALTIVVQKMQKPEIVEVEYVSAAEAAAPAPMTYAPVETAPVADIPPVEQATPQEPVVVVKPAAKALTKSTTKSPTKTKTPAPKAVLRTKPSHLSSASSSRAKTEAISHVEPMADISDIAVPMLSEANSNEVAHMSTKEIENDFDRIDEDQNSKLMAAVQDDKKMLDESAAELDQTTQAVASEEASELENAAAEKLRNLNAQKAELKKARQAAGPTGAPDVSASTLAAERAAKNAKSAGNGTGKSEKSESSAGTAHGVGSESEGIVRKLEDLRQKPGNPRPNYDVQDRVNGLSGTIIINAYVTKEGNLTLFRLIQSTGHRNLDRKTLTALKEWKFYPGQEGWVELPFKWDLKGGAQQKPTLLQRR
tara:strand:- start:233174 stop:234508 length:1335 start_codon:yes stop_codon:yes gene_type:complete